MDDLVYHYTDGNGLKGILESGELWCTHIAFLNDSREYLATVDLYRESLAQLSIDPFRDIDVRTLARLAIQLLDERFASATIAGILPTFVASFSTEPDDLAQWRAYGGTGPRFCIAFRREEIEKIRGTTLQAVTYEDGKATSDAMRDEFLAWADALIARRKKAPAPSRIEGTHPPEVFVINAQIIEPRAHLLKHRKYKAEAEVRLSHEWRRAPNSTGEPTKPLLFRSGRSFLIPYVCLDLKELYRPIHSVTIGPTPHPFVAQMGLRLLIQRCCGELANGADDRISVSEVPYRDW